MCDMVVKHLIELYDDVSKVVHSPLTYILYLLLAMVVLN